MDITTSRTITADFGFDIEEPATVVMHVRAAKSAGIVRFELLDIASDGSPLDGITTIDGDYGGLLHVLQPEPGRLTVSYRAELEVHPHAIAPIATPCELELLKMARPSRYCPSDHVSGLAHSEFGEIDSPGDCAAAIASWINARISYVSGTTDVHDSAEHTLLTGQGVCRDFAHLGILLCRALDIPARFASVYAPGLDPMDFHAVFEAWHNDQWWAYDATRLAPRQSLVRIATGRDAADASFATVTAGRATLTEMSVSAVSGGDLPLDLHDVPFALA
jgi:hypothetical protein